MMVELTEFDMLSVRFKLISNQDDVLSNWQNVDLFTKDFFGNSTLNQFYKWSQIDNKSGFVLVWLFNKSFNSLQQLAIDLLKCQVFGQMALHRRLMRLLVWGFPELRHLKKEENAQLDLTGQCAHPGCPVPETPLSL